MLLRAWGLMGMVSAACTMGVFFLVIYLPPLQVVFDSAALPLWVLGALVPMPVVVWGVDEVFHALRRRSESSGGPRAGDDLRGVGA